MIVRPAEAGYPTLNGLRAGGGGIRRMTEVPDGWMELLRTNLDDDRGLDAPTPSGVSDLRDDGDDDLDGRMRAILAVALASIGVGGTADLVMDRPTTWLSFHVVFETLMIAGALVMATTLWLGWWRAAHVASALRLSLERQSAERDRWRESVRQAREGLRRAIDAQFAAWHLTPAEREVAFLLLEGHGHKHIAALTGRSERTVRQHAGVVYEKSGLGGRAELSAFFLQDLLLPDEARSVRDG